MDDDASDDGWWMMMTRWRMLDGDDSEGGRYGGLGRRDARSDSVHPSRRRDGAVRAMKGIALLLLLLLLLLLILILILSK